MKISGRFPSAGDTQGKMLADAPVAPALASERPSLRDVYDEHVDFVWSALLRLGVAPSDADDATQEVFLVVHRRLDSFAHRASLRSWVYGICLRVASNHRRSQRSRRDGPSKSDDGDEVAASLAAAAPGPEELVSEQQARAMLEEALARLEPEQRLMIVMFEIDDLSGKEIASTLGLPIGTVHSRLHRAREAFRVAVERVLRSADRGTRRPT
ncbi:MAG: sigma-70 family RNA polymerase sigma factor [Labilithrix sp.]|nr:sigma-70 family RNA polymerase sigma factor [Labilithrix sp.]